MGSPTPDDQPEDEPETAAGFALALANPWGRGARLLSDVHVERHPVGMPSRRHPRAGALLRAFQELRSPGITEEAQYVFTKSGLPRQLVARVQRNDRLRAPLVPLGGGLWLVPRLDVSPLSDGAPCLHGAIFFKPLLPPASGGMFAQFGVTHMVYRRTFMRLLCAAATRLGYPAPTTANLKALYAALTPVFTFDPLRLPSDHAALITEYAGAGFRIGATFRNSSDNAPNIFAALSCGLSPEMGESEVREDLMGLLLQSPVASDFKNTRHEWTSRNFCERILESARGVHHSCQRLQYLRIFAEINPALGTPPSELSEFPLALHHVLDWTMENACRAHSQLDRPEVLQRRASRAWDQDLETYEVTAHSTAMNARYARLLVEAHAEYALADCGLEHYNDWFDREGYFRI
jgi:hypothetical protein